MSYEKLNSPPTADFAKYDAGFYDSFAEISYRAAQAVLAEVSEKYEFESVVDFGCGSATWLRAAREIVQAKGKTPRLLGIDGEYAKAIVDPRVATFIYSDLEKTINLDEKFDLAVSLEVAEHLSAGRAESFVNDLCVTSDVVLFGAAIPGQGGTNHINEQWQNYWHDLFSRQGYVAIDLLKQKFWSDERFMKCPYYVANTFLFVKTGHPLLSTSLPVISADHWSIRVVHPNLFVSTHFETASLPKTFGSIPRKLLSAISRRLR
jgi:hypothetical protein